MIDGVKILLAFLDFLNDCVEHVIELLFFRFFAALIGILDLNQADNLTMPV